MLEFKVSIGLKYLSTMSSSHFYVKNVLSLDDISPEHVEGINVPG